jgi:hypothetical protein
VDDPAQPDEPEQGREDELEEGLEQSALDELSKTRDEKAAECSDNVSGRTLIGHGAVGVIEARGFVGVDYDTENQRVERFSAYRMLAEGGALMHLARSGAAPAFSAQKSPPGVRGGPGMKLSIRLSDLCFEIVL